MFHRSRISTGALSDLEAGATPVLAALFGALYPAPRDVPPFAPAAGPARTGGRSSRYRLMGVVAAGGVALGALSAAGYAAITGENVTDRLFASFRGPGLDEGTPLGLALTIDGITVTVDRVIFDAQPVEIDGRLTKDDRGAGPRVVVPVLVQYTVSGLAGGTAHYNVSATLSTAGGKELPGFSSVGLSGSSEILGRSLPPDAMQSLTAFDASAGDIEHGMAVVLSVTVTRFEARGQSGAPHSDTAEAQEAVAGPSTGRFVFEFVVRQD